MDKFAMLIMKSRNRNMRDRMELPNQECSDKRKPTDFWEY